MTLPSPINQTQYYKCYSQGFMTDKSRKTILHCDLDAFFASVEQHDFPEFRGKPLVVGGSPEGRGVVAAASYEARKFGIHSAMPMAKAIRLCDHLIIRGGRYNRYSEISAHVFEIFSRFTPEVEAISIDEAFLDVTGCERLFGSGVDIAKQIRFAVKDEIGITISAGVAPSKFVAKLASELDKPDGLTIAPFDRRELIKWLARLPIRAMWGIGAKSEERLKQHNINTIGDIQRADVGFLKSIMGISGVHWKNLSLGIDDREVHTEHSAAKSVSHETTFDKDVGSVHKLRKVAMHLVEKVCTRLRKHKQVGKTVNVKIRYGDFSTFTRAKSLPVATDKTDVIFNEAWNLFQVNWTGRPIRLIGVGLSNLSQLHKQLSLFNESENRLDSAIDVVREKFGDNLIKRARQLEDSDDRPPSSSN